MDPLAPSSLEWRITGDRAISADGMIRLALNHPPPVPDVFNPIVSEALNRVLAKSPPAELMATHRWMGTEGDRQQGAVFAGRRLGQSPNPERVVITHSTQAAVHVLIPGIIRGGRPLAVEQMSYPPIRSFAARYGIRVVDVAIDADGLNPEAFEQICQKRETCCPVSGLYVSKSDYGHNVPSEEESDCCDRMPASGSTY